MNGQWLGAYSGTNTGTLIVELDDAGDHYEGTVMAVVNDPVLPSILGIVQSAPKHKDKFDLRVPLTVVDRGTGLPVDLAAFARKFPDITWPQYADSAWTVEDDKIAVNWHTPIGTFGNGLVLSAQATKPSGLRPIPDITSWAAFKEYATKLEPYRFAFRGQENNKWQLRASFYRTGRGSLLRFSQNDVAALHRHLSGLTSHRFNLNDPLDYAAFLNLVQHHGYPTPLLDWTYSPFIATYFAFRNVGRESLTPGRRVRILIFSSKQWTSDFERAQNIGVPFRHITMLEPLAINNPRVVPQQSISMVTNVDNLENYVSIREKEKGKTYLQAIDLPATERRNVMRELDLMGINAGSLFPGLDGACQQLKERFFEL